VPRACVIVLDAVGAGELPDAADFGDEGSDTLGNVAKAVGGLDLPNLEALGLTGGLVLQRDAIAVLREERSAGRRHELVLLDPPYESWAALETVLAGLLPDVVADGGIVVVESDARTEPSLPLDLVRTRRYGSARLTLFAP